MGGGDRGGGQGRGTEGLEKVARENAFKIKIALFGKVSHHRRRGHVEMPTFFLKSWELIVGEGGGKNGIT